MAYIVRVPVPGVYAIFATTLPTAADTALLRHFKQPRFELLLLL
jgi:hypothetical protein